MMPLLNGSAWAQCRVVCFTCCSNQARPPCELQESHSDRREVENKLPANAWSLELCGVDVGTTLGPCDCVRRCLRPECVLVSGGGARGSEDGHERRCSTSFWPVNTRTLGGHFHINCLAAVYSAAHWFVSTGWSPSSVGVPTNGHVIRQTEILKTGLRLNGHDPRLQRW